MWPSFWDNAMKITPYITTIYPNLPRFWSILANFYFFKVLGGLPINKSIYVTFPNIFGSKPLLNLYFYESTQFYGFFQMVLSIFLWIPKECPFWERNGEKSASKAQKLPKMCRNHHLSTISVRQCVQKWPDIFWTLNSGKKSLPNDHNTLFGSYFVVYCPF